MKAFVTLVSILVSATALAWGFGPGGGGGSGGGGGGGGWRPGDSGGGNQPGGGGGVAFTFDTFITDATNIGGCIVHDDLMTGYIDGEEAVVLPSTVKRIADGALAGNESVTTLDATAATGLTTIPNSFASGCGGLAAVALPANVTTIGASAFAMDAALTNFTGTGVTTIGDYAFYGCTALVLPASTTYETTGTAAFDGVSYATTDNDVYCSELAPLVTWLAKFSKSELVSSGLSTRNTEDIRLWLTNDVANLENYLYADEIATNGNFKALTVSGTNFLFTAQDIATLSVAHAALQVSTDLVTWKTVSESDIVDGVYTMPSTTNGFARIIYSLTW